MRTHHRIILGDARQMAEVPDESVHLIITSPPYWQLKDYGDERQIGFHDSYEDYINNLNLVWQECFRVLHKGCRMCVNIGDQFARSVYYGRYKVIPIRTEIIKFCETLGMDYMGAIIWQKVTTTNTTGGATVMGSFPYPRNGILKIDYEFILIFKKLGDAPKVSREIRGLSKLSTEEWNAYFSGHWTFGGEKQDKHLAMFPVELPRRLIRMFSFGGDTVLDPFLGSGTTSLAAKELGRNSIGYEINAKFMAIIREKLGVGRGDLFGETTYEFVKQGAAPRRFSELMARLPHKFSDPHRLDKRVDPRKLKFGSRVEDGDTGCRSELFGVKEVLSPERLQLDNGLCVRLLGIVEKPLFRTEAMEFLRQRTRGTKVFLRFDKEKHDEQGNLLAYVYLKNKTFLNGHLARTGLVAVDASREFRLRRHLLQLHRQGSVEDVPTRQGE
ncbi:MAG: DNA methyltransferase [bacterium]|jgi:site-specific DNA-methyltransferase (adenine-specific)|nr:DNA methyltransferase [candidate division KSB1 bacterium]MDH7559822.1 DNA methyltransferase [bacterium]